MFEILDIKEFISTGSVLVAGLWVLYTYYQRRLGLPRGTIDNKVSIRPFGEKSLWIHVEMTLENKGQTRILLKYARCRVQQCLPENSEIIQHVEYNQGFHRFLESADGEVPWLPPLGPGNLQISGVHAEQKPLQMERRFSSGCGEVEPGETETIHFDFFVTRDVKLVCILTELLNSAKDPKAAPWKQILQRINFWGTNPLCWTRLTFVEVAVPSRKPKAKSRAASIGILKATTVGRAPTRNSRGLGKGSSAR